MASVGAGEQVSGTPFSSRPFSDDNGHPCSVGQLVAGWGGALRQSSLLVSRSTAATPKALLDMISFCYHSSPGKPLVLITQVYRERKGLRGGKATGSWCRLGLDGLQTARAPTPRARASFPQGILSHTQVRKSPKAGAGKGEEARRAC